MYKRKKARTSSSSSAPGGGFDENGEEGRELPARGGGNGSSIRRIAEEPPSGDSGRGGGFDDDGGIYGFGGGGGAVTGGSTAAAETTEPSNGGGSGGSGSGFGNDIHKIAMQIQRRSAELVQSKEEVEELREQVRTRESELQRQKSENLETARVPYLEAVHKACELELQLHRWTIQADSLRRQASEAEEERLRVEQEVDERRLVWTAKSGELASAKTKRQIFDRHLQAAFRTERDARIRRGDRLRRLVECAEKLRRQRDQNVADRHDAEREVAALESKLDADNAEVQELAADVRKKIQEVSEEEAA